MNPDVLIDLATISIHAAQKGCDEVLWITIYLLKDFNPRSPRGLRLQVQCYRNLPFRFQSTQPKRAATQIHKRKVLKNENFNPRSPRGLRLALLMNRFGAIKFQSTQPKRAATFRNIEPEFHLIFQSTQPKRAATHLQLFLKRLRKISIHAAQEGCDLRSLTVF